MQVILSMGFGAVTHRPVAADLIYFRKGGRVQAPAVLDGQNLTIDLAGTSYRFEREDLEAHVSGLDPQSEWIAGKSELEGKPSAERFSRAWWALENGLVEEAVEELGRIHALDSEHSPTRRMVEVVERLQIPCEDPAFEPFQQALGVTTRVERGPHIVLLHQHSQSEAQERVAFLERVTTAYHLIFAGSGLSLNTPRRRLIFAWLADRQDYQSFLKANSASAFASTRGYHHPTWNAVLVYDARSGELQRRDRADLEKRRGELEAFQATLKSLPPRARLRVVLTGERPRGVGRADGQALVDRLNRDVSRLELLLEAERRALDDGIAAHELIHLLAVDSGLNPRHDAFPIWLQEGLAMQFEVFRGGRWAGIGRPHDIRLHDWRRLPAGPALEPLLRDRGFGKGYRRDPYVQAWALVYFLRARHGERFLRYLDLLRTPPDHSSPRPTQVQTFQRVFGEDLTTLEQEWREYLADSRTPLEVHEPRALTPAEQGLNRGSSL